MKRSASTASAILVLALLPAGQAWAEPTLYGRANLSFEWVDEDDRSVTELQNNASRLGIKGDHQLNDQYQLVYQLEYGVDFDDSDTFSQRNIYLGLQSDWGRVIAGHFDTPFKASQDKVDLFNDLRGDIGKTISRNEYRQSNSIMYSTPEAVGPVRADVAYIASEEEGAADGKSAALSYSTGGLYAAVAVDQDVEQEGTDAARLTSVYRRDAWQIGGLYEVADADIRGSNNGWLLSGAYDISAWVIKAQLGQSDIREEGGETLSVGADYAFSKAARVFAFYTASDADQRPADHYLGAGLELRF